MISFPKPGKAVKKSTRELDPHYVWWVHGWTCCVPGCVTPWPVHAHHAVLRSQGGADRSCVPLCQAHHVGTHGIHVKGKLTWERLFNVDLLERVKWFNEQYEAKAEGPRQYLLPPFGSKKLSAG